MGEYLDLGGLLIGDIDVESGHILERARSHSKIIKMINTCSLSTPTGQNGRVDWPDEFYIERSKT